MRTGQELFCALSIIEAEDKIGGQALPSYINSQNQEFCPPHCQKALSSEPRRIQRIFRKISNNTTSTTQAITGLRFTRYDIEKMSWVRRTNKMWCYRLGSGRERYNWYLVLRSSPAPLPYRDRDGVGELAMSKKSAEAMSKKIAETMSEKIAEAMSKKGEEAKPKKGEEAKSVNRMLRPIIRNESELTIALEELLALYSPTGRCRTVEALGAAIRECSSKYSSKVMTGNFEVRRRMAHVYGVLYELESALKKVAHRVTRGDLLEGAVELIETLCNILDDVNLLVERLREQLRLTNRAWWGFVRDWEMQGLQKDIVKKCDSVIRQMHTFRLGFDPSLA